MRRGLTLYNEPMSDNVPANWYDSLKEELDSLVTEMQFNVRWQLIEWNHKIGQTIREHTPTGQVDICLQRLAHELKISKRSLYNAVAIYDKFPEISQIPDGKNASMNKLLKQINGTSTEKCDHLEIETIKVCKGCGKKV